MAHEGKKRDKCNGIFCFVWWDEVSCTLLTRNFRGFGYEKDQSTLEYTSPCIHRTCDGPGPYLYKGKTVNKLPHVTGDSAAGVISLVIEDGEMGMV